MAREAAADLIRDLRKLLVDGAIGAGPIGLAELFAIDLACRSFRDLCYEVDGFGGFHAAQFRLAVVEDFFRRQ